MLNLIAQIANPFPQVNTGAGNTTIATVLTITFGIIGSITLLFIVIGGFRYIISGGDPQGTARAKNTIIYAVIGLAITISATVIVNFVAGKL